MFNLSVRKFLPCVTLAALVCAAPPPSHAQMKYRIIELDTGNAQSPAAVAINNRGDILVTSDNVTIVFHDGKKQDLSMLNQGINLSLAMNNKGDIAGICYPEAAATAFLFHENVRVLIRQKNEIKSDAHGINDQGDVVGETSSDLETFHGFVYHDGKIQVLGTLGGKTSSAYGINNKGDIVGLSATGHNSDFHAFLYHDGKMRDLHTLGGNTSDASAINDQGDVIGVADLASGYGHAFLFRNGKMQDLGTLGGSGSEARAINNKGDIVGNADLKNSDEVAFLYTGGKMLNLNSFLPKDSHWQLVRAFGINGSGSIVGLGLFNGKQKAFLMEPIVSAEKKEESKGK